MGQEARQAEGGGYQKEKADQKDRDRPEEALRDPIPGAAAIFASKAATCHIAFALHGI
jgi:hypothetical protein